MGELYNPYPKLPKNIRQIGDRDQIIKLYVEDYVNTYLKRLYPMGGQDLRAGLLLGESRTEDGTPYIFVDGAMEMEGITESGEKIVFTEEAWKKAYQTIEQRFPKRSVIGWFLCGAPGCTLSPLNYWKQHNQYFSAKHQLMYLNSSLENEEAIYTASEDGFYKLRGYSIYYERNQMMQDYMVSRSEAHRVESGARDEVIRDFRQKMDNKRQDAYRQFTMTSILGAACSVLAVAVLASGVAMFNNYHKMKEMESVIASVLPEGTARKWSDYMDGSVSEKEKSVDIEEIPGEVYPTRAEIVIEAVPPASGKESGQTAESGQAAASDADVSGFQQPASGADSGIGADVPSGDSSDYEAGAASGTGAISETDSDKGTGMETSADPPAEPVQIPADAVTHIVQEGETLYGICIERYHSLSHLSDICRWNGLEDENRISIGQELLLPPE